MDDGYEFIIGIVGVCVAIVVDVVVVGGGGGNGLSGELLLNFLFAGVFVFGSFGSCHDVYSYC